MDPQSEMDAVSGWPSGAACRLKKEQCPTSVGKETEGEERGVSTAALRKADTRVTHRPEPPAKAQDVFGTNKLADVAAR